MRRLETDVDIFLDFPKRRPERGDREDEDCPAMWLAGST